MFRFLAIVPLALAFCSSAPAAISLAFSPGFPVLVPVSFGSTGTIDIVATSDQITEDITFGNALLTLDGTPGFTFASTGTTSSGLVALTPTAGIGSTPVTVATFLVNVDTNPPVSFGAVAVVTGTFDSIDLSGVPSASGGVFTNTQVVAAVPEPSSLGLLGLCGVGMVVPRRRK